MKPDGVAAYRSLYGVYRDGAKRRRHSFLLTFEEFKQLTAGNCHYCGAPPAQRYKNKKNLTYCTYNGVDRVDNEVGYELDNCVTCCGVCNKLKGTLDTQAFLAAVERIHRYQAKDSQDGRQPVVPEN